MGRRQCHRWVEAVSQVDQAVSQVGGRQCHRWVGGSVTGGWEAVSQVGRRQCHRWIGGNVTGG